MSSMTLAPVVAGVDGSGDARIAVDLAAWEAKRRGAALRLVTADPPMYGYGVAPIGYDPAQTSTEYGSVLAAEEARVRLAHPELTISTAVVQGTPGGVLVAESTRAQLVVVGSRGRGGFATLLLGSVSAQVAAHASAPVIVVRPPAVRGDRPTPVTGPVVVGVDGSTGSESALGFAFDEAAARGTGLVAVSAWDEPLPLLSERGGQEAEAALGEALAGWADKYPDVPVRRVVVLRAVPARAILEEAGTAALVVVGQRGRGGFAGLRLGSVSDGLVRHAHCPVAVVPAAAR